MRNTNEQGDFQNTKAEADRLELQGRVGKTGKNRAEERLLESFLKKNPFIIQAAGFSSVNRKASMFA